MNRFKFLDHSGDLGLKVWSSTLEGIFSLAAQGLYSVITDFKKIASRVDHHVSLQADQNSDLLVQWLNHLNYLFVAEEMLFKKFNFQLLKNGNLQAQLLGESFCAEKHEIFREIKAVTYHQLVFKKQYTGWYAQVIFDL